MTLLAGLTRSPERAVLALIAAFFVFHVILAATLGLGVDEAYGVSVARDLKLSYFDHPPLNYWIAHTFMPLFGDGRALRLPFIAMFAGTTWLLFVLTRRLFGGVAGVWAALALNLSAFYTLAGGWILPDGPLMFCLMAAACVLARGFFPKDKGEAPAPWMTWIVAGIFIGLAALSKYHAALFALGLLIYIVSARERLALLRHPAPWVGGLVALAVVSPVLIWNAEHHWVSFAFQGGRATAHGFPKIGHFLANLGGQFLWMLPWIFVPMVIAAWGAVRLGRGADRSWYCLCLAMPAVLIFTLVPLWGDRGLPHWQMPGWLFLFPVLGDYLAREAAIRTRPRTWAITSAALLAALAFLIIGHAATGYGRTLLPSLLGKRDPTLEAYEWTPLRGELARRGLLKQDGLFVVSASWIDIGKIDLALHGELQTQVFGESKQYAFRFDPKIFLGRDALIIGRADRTQGIDKALAPYFASIEELPNFVFGRSGMPEVTVRILQARGLKKELPSPYPR